MQDYLHWRSKVTLHEVFSADQPLTYPSFLGDKVVFLSAIQDDAQDPNAKSRSVLMLNDSANGICLTPQPYSLRTSVNEYGGKPYWLFGEEVVFANQTDQCLYWQNLKNVDLSDLDDIGEPKRITIKPTLDQRYMFSDVHALGAGRYLAIVELFDAQKGAENNRCFIGLIDANQPDVAPVELVSGADFYSNLVLNIHGQLAWVQWNHPMMPWDENHLFTAQLNNDYAIDNIEQLKAEAFGDAACYCQLAFDDSGVLYFSADFAHSDGAANYWNVYCHQAGRISRLTDFELEFGYPHWQYGDVRITHLVDDKMVAIGSDVSGDRLFLLDAQRQSSVDVYGGGSTIQHVASNGNGAMLAIETAFNSKSLLCKFDLSDAVLRRERIKSGVEYKHSSSPALAVSYTARDGAQAYGFYYAPINQNAAVKNIDTAPPLIVMVHGGPTARAYGHFDIQKQYWAANGFAIFDVNHRGSSGYGRAYRDALYGLWGERDASDIIDGIEYLIENGMADKNRVCIRGKSAGGYAVLRVLTEYPSVFKAGACYYGIGNLATLAEVTHKFEKHYTDRLIDEVFEPETAKLPNSRYHSRSPINKIDQIQSAMIVFQGGADKVVPPTVAHEVVASLAANNIPHQYVEYADEGHGFRQAANNIDAWEKELAFYRGVLSA